MSLSESLKRCVHPERTRLTAHGLCERTMHARESLLSRSAREGLPWARGYLPLRQCPVVSAIRLSAPWVNRMGRTHLAVKGCLGPEALPSLLLSLEDDLHAVLRLSRLPPSPRVHISEELFGGSSVLPESVLAVCGRGAAWGMILLIRASSQMLPVLSSNFHGHPPPKTRNTFPTPEKWGGWKTYSP